jgi:hypothetical protein
VPDAVAKIAEGNIGAAVCIMDLMKHSEEIDPLSYLKVIGPVMLLDSLGIYGPNVWVIFNDLRTEPCKNARSAACHSWACFQAKHCWRFQTGSTEMKEK